MATVEIDLDSSDSDGVEEAPAPREDEVCGLCSEPYTSSRYGAPCNHWACVECWHDLMDDGETTCPFCNEDITDWLEWLQSVVPHPALEYGDDGEVWLERRGAVH